MKLQKCVKLISIIVTIFLVISMVFSFNSVHAFGDLISGADNFVKNGEGSSVLNEQSQKDISADIYNILFVIGIVVAAIIGVILGIKFITGSVEQKSEVKESLIPYFARMRSYIWSIWHMEVSSSFNRKNIIRF